MIGENNDPYIQIYENALSNNICEEIIKMFEDNNEQHIDGCTMNGINKNTKVTKEIHFSNEPFNKYDNILFESLNKYLNNYYKVIKKDVSPNIMDTGYQLQKYVKKEGFYKWHQDSVTLLMDNIPSTRIITYLWYLNNVEEGGETLFTDFKITPKTGSLLLFPATWTYMHSGAMPISNDKYIITGWIWEQFK